VRSTPIPDAVALTGPASEHAACVVYALRNRNVFKALGFGAVKRGEVASCYVSETAVVVRPGMVCRVGTETHPFLEGGPTVTKNMFALISMLLLAALACVQTAAAEGECKADSDCKAGNVCILALTPHVCKPPQPAGAACKRDVVCASKKCELPSGKDVGVCK
jgi:Cys-rich repeat protein